MRMRMGVIKYMRVRSRGKGGGATVKREAVITRPRAMLTMRHGKRGVRDTFKMHEGRYNSHAHYFSLARGL